MLQNILTVGGYTLLSRITGFVRDLILAAILGAGPVADAFFVAFRLPNHFRAIFAEGAFNTAFVPAYARVVEQGGKERAALFADRIFTLLLASQIVLLVAALVFTGSVIELLAPGFAGDPARFPLAVERDAALIGEAVHAADRDINGLVLVHRARRLVDGHLGGAAHHDPMLGAMAVLL